MRWLLALFLFLPTSCVTHSTHFEGTDTLEIGLEIKRTIRTQHAITNAIPNH